MISTHRKTASTKVAALLSATSIPLLFASPAFAQSYVEQSAGDIVYSEESVWGTPEAVYLRSTGGSVLVDIGDAAAWSTAGTYGQIVEVEAATGATVTIGVIASGGDGYVTGLQVNGGSGAVDIDVGEVDLLGEMTYGVLAYADGPVSVNADWVYMGGEGTDFNISGLTSDGIYARSYTDAGSITANSITVNGIYSSAAIAWGATGATLNVGEVVSNATYSTILYADGGTGDVSVNLGTVTLGGSDTYGLVARSEGGAVDVTVGSLEDVTGQNDGILIRNDTLVTLDVGSVTTAYQSVIIEDMNGGLADVEVVVREAVTSQGMDAISIEGATIDLLIEEGAVVTGGLSGAYLRATGDVVVDNQGTIEGAGMDRGALDIDTAGNILVNSDIVTATGDGGPGILAQTSSGDITIDANITSALGANYGNLWTSDAIIALTNSGDATVTSNEAYSDGLYGSGVVAVSYDGNALIDSGLVSTTGDYGVAIYVNGTETATLVSDTVTTTGVGANAIQLYTPGVATATVGDITTADGYGVLIQGDTSASVTVEGTIDASRYGVLLGSAGAGDIVINGTVMSETFYAVGGETGGDLDIMIASGAVLDAEYVGLYAFSDMMATVVNAGTIMSRAEDPNMVAIQFGGAGNGYLRNEGTISSFDGRAVNGSTQDDLFETTQTSVIDGFIDGMDGVDTLRLVMDADAAMQDGQVVDTVNVEHLVAASGTFYADNGSSNYQMVTIDEGAELVVEVDDLGSAITGDAIVTNGQLTVDLALDTVASLDDLAAGEVTGTGTLGISGEGTFVIDDGTLLQQEGGFVVEEGTLSIADTGSYGGLVTTAAGGTFTLGEGDFSGDLVNDGTFVIDRESDYVFVGDFTGTGTFEKDGASAIVFEGLYAFDGTTTINGGSLAFAGTIDPMTEIDLDSGTMDLSMVEGGAATVTSLEGDGGTLVLGGTDLTIDQMVDTSYAGDITGDGTLTKDGDGTLNLTGDLSYTGDIEVDGGKLAVNGDASGADLFVNTGGTLGGNGTVGDTTVQGGTIGAGNSIGELTIAGDLVLTADSTFEVEVNDAGDADLVNVTGMADLGGSTLAVLAEDGTYAPITTYTILTADGGVSGEFGEATSNFAFLTPVVTYSANDVMLTMARNDIDFVDLADGANQEAIAGLISGLGFASPLYYETLLLSQGNVATSFATLTGEQYGGLTSAMVESVDLLRHQVRPATPADDGLFAWGRGIISSASADAAGDMLGSDLDGTGLMGGLGYSAAGFTASAGVGRLGLDSDGFDLDGLDMTVWSANVGYDAGGLNLDAGVLFGNGDGTASRATSLGTIAERLEAEVDGDFSNLYAQAAYGLPMGGSATLSPYVGLSHVSVDIDDVTEMGGVSALSVTGLDRDVTFGDAGLRLDAMLGETAWAYGSVGLRQAWGDREATSSVAFAGGSRATIGSMPIDKTAVRLGAGVGFSSGAVSVSVGYNGTISDRFDSHGGKAGISFSF